MPVEKRYVYTELTKPKLGERLVEIGKEDDAGNEQVLDCLVDFVATVITRLEIEEGDEAYFVPLHSDILGHTYGKSKDHPTYYKQLVRLLEDLEVLEVSHQFVIGERSKGYRINPQLVGTVAEETINTDHQNIEPEILSRHAARHLADVGRLHFDVAKANQVVQRLHIFKRLALTTWVKRWSVGDTRVKQDPNNRLYSNLTGLNKEFRQCLSYQGQGLYSVDLKQAHQYLFLYVLGQKVKQNAKVPLHQFMQRPKTQDVKRYSEDVRSEHFIDIVHQQVLRNRKKIDRNEVKVGVLAEVFYQRLKKNQHRIVRAFADLYPTVWHYIQLIKQNDYKIMAKLLMKKESEVMNTAVMRLYDQHPAGLFIRLHDAVITTRDMIDVVGEMITEVGNELVGFPPRVTTSQFNVPDGDLSDHPLSLEELFEQYQVDGMMSVKEVRRRMEQSIYSGKNDWGAFAQWESRVRAQNTVEYLERQFREAHQMRY